jgi:sugar/nucleoside kinase (ribokinase family)
MAKPPDFVAVGHVTRDLVAGGGYSLGGTATFAALSARNLGLSAAILTSAPAEFVLTSMLSGIDLRVVPAAEVTTFENIYEGQRRHQFLHSVASGLHPSDLPPYWANAPLALLGPVAGELGSDWVGAFSSALVAATPQGWMRQWDSQGRVASKPWLDAERILHGVDVLVFSEEDVCGDENVVLHYASLARIAVVTRGAEGATVFHQGSSHDVAAFRAQVRDPTGAGDVFATAFLVRLMEIGDPVQAAVFANCAASLAVEGQGVTAIPMRKQVEERLRRYESSGGAKT